MEKIKKCQISNYLPDRKTKHCTYDKWCSTYSQELTVLYKILIIDFCEKFDGSKISWNSHYDSFKRMIYKKSSKHLLRI